jgi:hypothetical protein
MKFFLGVVAGGIIFLISAVFSGGDFLNGSALVKENLKRGIFEKDNTKNKIINDNFIPGIGYEYGVWLWSSPFFLKEKMTTIIDGIKIGQFNTVYLSVDDFLLVKNIDKENYLEELYKFVKQANDSNLVVDIVAGAPEWAEPKNRWQAYKFINLLIEYNDKYPDTKIRGLQYDIEPYLLPNYENNKKKILNNFVEFIDIVSTRFEKYPEASLTVVLPHFYDKKQNWAPMITYQRETLSVFDQIAKSLNKIEKGKIILMAYRNFFTGENGVDNISRVEFESIKGKTKVIIAQETKNISPAYVTFWGLSKKNLFRQLNQIQINYKDYENFAGVAIHDFEGFTQLKK